MPNAPNPIAVAIDESELGAAQSLLRKLAGEIGWIKLGMEFFFAQGRSGYEQLARLGLPVFLDLKLHDIPNSVAAALNSLMRLEPRPGIVNVHASGGRAMMEAAADAVKGRAKLIAVTVLTSLEESDLADIGLDGRSSSADHALMMAKLAKSSGLDGVVCSPHDVAQIKGTLGKDFLAIVPGVRPEGSGTGDQKRVATPGAARKAGADLLVIGRPITRAKDPQTAARAIAKEVMDAG
ncbi:MAG: orotidine-5'-phosphate decarboxylase [Aestuariivirgaceae bacterium]